IPGGRFDAATERTELAVVAVLVEGEDLLQLQLSDFFRPGPDDGLAGLVRFHRVLAGALDRVAERLAQHHDNELERVMIVILEDDVVRRQQARPGGHIDFGLDCHAVPPAARGRGQRFWEWDYSTAKCAVKSGKKRSKFGQN